MLTNLLKYEFKASGRVVLPIASGVLVLNIFTGILSHFIQNTSDRFPLAGLALVLLNLAALVSLLVVLAVCFFIEVQQFYRLLGDRGYLMLALPVQPWKHIAAKVICGTAWTVFGMLFFSVCCALLTGDFAFSVPHAEDFAIWAVMVLIVLALIAGALLHTYLACAFAGQFTQQRMLISIAAYFVIGFAGQMAALVTAFFVALYGYQYFSNINFSTASSIFSYDNSLPFHAGRLCAHRPRRCPYVGTDPVVHDQAAESGVITESPGCALRLSCLCCTVFSVPSGRGSAS